MEKCPYCNREVGEQDNFCAICGESLTELARNLKTKERLRAQAELLSTLPKKLKNSHDLNVISDCMDKIINQMKEC